MIICHRAFIALIPVLILSSVLMVTAIAASEHAVIIRLATTYRLDALVARHRALGCVSASLLLLAQDPYYMPSSKGDKITLGSDESCAISSIQNDGNEASVISTGHAGKSTSQIEAHITLYDDSLPVLFSWKEI